MSELVLGSAWSNPDRRRAQATRAARDMDEGALGELLTYYLIHEGRKAAAVSPQTKRAYLSGMRAFLAFAGPAESPSAPLLKCSREDLKRYVVHEQLRGLKPESVRLHMASVRCLFRALEWAGAVDKSPAEGVSAPPDPRPRHERRDAVALDDYRTLLQVVSARDTTPAVRARDGALLRCLGDLGLRVSEVAALQIGDLNLRRGMLTVQRGKGGKRRQLPMTKAASEALRAWLEVRNSPGLQGAKPGELKPGESVFINLSSRTPRALLHAPMSAEAIRGVLQGLYRAAGLEPQGCHALRHTALTRIYQKSKDLHLTAKVAGHSSVDTTSIYAHMQLDDVRAIMDTLDD